MPPGSAVQPGQLQLITRLVVGSRGDSGMIRATCVQSVLNTMTLQT